MLSRQESDGRLLDGDEVLRAGLPRGGPWLEWLSITKILRPKIEGLILQGTFGSVINVELREPEETNIRLLSRKQKIPIDDLSQKTAKRWIANNRSYEESHFIRIMTKEFDLSETEYGIW